MAVKIGKLWNNSKFSSLTNNSKLLYIYLCTNPSINSVGVCSLDIRSVGLHINLEIEELRTSTSELIEKDFILCSSLEGLIYFTVLDHFSTLPKSDATVSKVSKDLNTIPKKLREILKSRGISTDRKVVKFVEPSEEEILEFALSQGYTVNASDVIGYYRNKASYYGIEGFWVDSRGKKVKDWKSKLRTVWFKDENKLKSVKGAPKGFEHFHINFEGKLVFPDFWKNGKPVSKNIAVNTKLQRAYEERRS